MRYFARKDLPFRGVSTPAPLLNALGQQWRLLGFGRQPALLGVSRSGEVVFSHIGDLPQDLPDLDAALDAIAAR